jgi:hypothetical protein
VLAQLLWWAAAASWARKQQTTNVITIDIPLDNWLLLSHVLDNLSSLGNQFALYCCKSDHNVIRISEENKKYMMKCVLIHSNGDFGQNRKQNTNYQDLIWIKIIWQPKNLHFKLKMLTNKYLTNSSLVTMLNYAGTPVLFWARVRNCCCCSRYVSRVMKYNKSLSTIWQRFSDLFDDGIAKICKKFKYHSGFLSYLQDRTANLANMAAIICPALVCP